MSYGSCGETLTQHQDNLRSGAELCETALNPESLLSRASSPSSFGLLRSLSVDERVFAQPLLVNNVSTPSGMYDVVYVASMNNTLYAFPQNGTDALWSVSLGTSYPYANITGGGGEDNNINVLGILGTPVIDKAQGRIFAVAAITTGPGQFAHQLHALNIGDGTAASGSPVTISGGIAGNSSDAVDGVINFDSKQHLQRPALLHTQDQILVTFGSHVDQPPYHGWIFGYDTATLAQTVVFSATRTVLGGSIWQSGQGPSVDSDGFVYAIAASSPSQEQSSIVGVDFIESILRMQLSPSNLTVESYFTPTNWQELDAADVDIGSAGVLVVPDSELRIGGGKDGLLYALNATNFGGLQSGDPQVLKVNTTPDNVVWGAPVYHDVPVLGQSVYVWSAASNVRAYSIRGGILNDTIASQSAILAPSTQPGGILTVSSNNGTGGIVWADSVIDEERAGVLYAFNASDLSQTLWSSNDTAARDGGYAASKFCAPTVGGGQVFLPTFDGQVRVFGLTAPAPSASVGLAGNQSGGDVTASAAALAAWSPTSLLVFIFAVFNLIR